MNDDLMKLMGWINVRDDGSLRTGLTEPYTLEKLREQARFDAGLSIAAEAAIEEINGKTLWTPPQAVQATGRPVNITRSAPTAPGSERRNDFQFFFEKFEQLWDEDRSFYTTGALCAPLATYGLAGLNTASRPVFNSLPQFHAPRGFSGRIQQFLHARPGTKVSAAPEGDDEDIQSGFQGTSQEDIQDFVEKPGTPEHNEEVRGWISNESWSRSMSGATEHDSAVMIRDAHLQRYAQTEADALIEEMLDL